MKEKYLMEERPTTSYTSNINAQELISRYLRCVYEMFILKATHKVKRENFYRPSNNLVQHNTLL